MLERVIVQDLLHKVNWNVSKSKNITVLENTCVYEKCMTFSSLKC